MHFADTLQLSSRQKLPGISGTPGCNGDLLFLVRQLRAARSAMPILRAVFIRSVQYTYSIG